MRFRLILLLHLVTPAWAAPAHAGTFVVDQGAVKLSTDTASLQISAVAGGRSIAIAEATATSLESQGFDVQFSKSTDGALEITVRASESKPFAWPRIALDPAHGELIWPRAEGSIIPLSDGFWRGMLTAQDWDTLESLSMPFWAVRDGDTTITWLVSTQFRNTIKFEARQSDFAMSSSHDFHAKSPERSITFRVYVDVKASPITPALHYRDWLVERGELRTLAEKAKTTPSVERLSGALHTYIWGDAPITRTDIPKKNWKPFCMRLVAESQEESDPPPLAVLLHTIFSKEQWDAVVRVTKEEYSYPYLEQQIAAGLSVALASGELFKPSAWDMRGVPEDLFRQAQQASTLTTAQRVALGSQLLAAAFPDTFVPSQDWGDGVSLKMLRALEEAGIDRARLCTDGWEGIEARPWIAEQAVKQGYLIGTYDSYHSVHDPKLAGTDKTWATAQMTAELYENGGIMNASGEYLKGFKQVGRKLSPVAARPFVEQRVASIFKAIPFNYSFIDCDAFGEVYDDYHPAHPLSMEEDARARASRLEWIAVAQGAAVGSEGGSAYAVPAVHVLEGVFDPNFGWGDKEMSDRNSPYYPGRYYPPEAPEIYFKPVKIKQQYQKQQYDPRFKLPLFEAVYHDCVVSTHHWSNSSFKYPEVRNDVALTEFLYLSPPLYHLTLDEFAKRKAAILAHYKAWSPLHRAHGFDALTAFEWLTPDRLVQATQFGPDCRVVANYGETEYEKEGMKVPAHSVRVKLADNEITYSPLP